MTIGIQSKEALLRTTLLETIAAKRDGLRASEMAVADLILADPVRAMDFNMAGLADAAKVSEPTVMRFCSAIGFDGFRSFKIKLAQTVALGLPVTLSAIEQGDSPSDLTAKVFNHTISSLDRARRHLDDAVMTRVIETMSRASEIIFIGTGASGIVALDAQQKHPLFGVPCFAPMDFHQQFIAAAMSGPRSVIVAISNTGHTESTLRVAQSGKSAGATIIAITGGGGPLSLLADLEIPAVTFEDTDFYTPTVSRLAALVIIDILATGVAMRSGADALEKIRLMKATLAEMRGTE
ncbi:SIS domain-containing protein [Cryobacterium glaciale]|uniref:SIS domain-containing protein n=1 Tax=Cryobacterium glaciale TaxID=1259145 RepID=A0A4R8UZ11_9MICO|nr:SIS domain-containing protein [Cryobacterium glaciale]TFB74992.1 SIS domain-containing protein [Cryobacterium glaciale]